jgi:mitochondrial import receptor subunit TOM20
MATDLRPSTIVAATAGVLATGVLAYAVYFDHRRRSDPEYRRALKRENKRLAKAAKEEEHAKQTEDIKKVKELLDKANAEGYPTAPEEVEVYFMQEVAEGEKKSQDGETILYMSPVSRVWMHGDRKTKLTGIQYRF